MLAVITHDSCLEHHAGAGHPERPERLVAVLDALRNRPAIAERIVWHEAVEAPTEAIARIHAPHVTERLVALERQGGGRIDADTALGARSFAAVRRASGAGLRAVEVLEATPGRDGPLSAALCAVRPPGHHATPTQSMGFCLYNNLAITAAALAERGKRVAIVDFDVHHGNGTQDAFYSRRDVLFVSLHQHPWYPGSGSIGEIGAGEGRGYTLNFPFPAGTTGGAYRRAIDQIVAPRVEAFAPTWLLLSAGFDAHRLDPLAELALSAGDFADLIRRLRPLVPAGRTIAFLEGGYHIDALARSVTAMVGALVDVEVAGEAPTDDDEPPTLAAVARALAELG